MTNKLTHIIMTSALLVSIGLGTYLYFQPKEAAVIATNYISAKKTTLTYANVEKHILSDSEVHYMWFSDLKSNDGIYVRDYVVKPLAQELGITEFESLEFIDFYEAPDSDHYMTSTWGFSDVPAFVAAQNVDGKIVVLNFLSWNKDNPFDSEDLKTWMYDNGLWTGVYEKVEKIAEAIK